MLVANRNHKKIQKEIYLEQEPVQNVDSFYVFHLVKAMIHVGEILFHLVNLVYI